MNGHAIDTFSILWANLKFYVFCPFSLIGASISKIKREMAARIMIKPWWVTQFWFPMMVPHLQDFSVVLPPNILTLSFNKGLQHPLHPKMKLQAVQLLGSLQTHITSITSYLRYLGIVVSINKVQI